VVVKELREPRDFLNAAEPLLLADEARNNLVLGIAGTLRDHPGVYDERRLWIVLDGRGRVAAAALQTPPYNLVLAGPASEDALEALIDGLHRASVELPGVTAAVPEALAFATRWGARRNVRARRRMAQRIHRLEALRQVEGVAGHARHATETDRALVVEWVAAFAAEVAREDAPAHEAERVVDAGLRRGAGGFTIWEDDGAPVSLAGWGGRTPNGVRIGPVYTPPAHRRRGYGSAVTAAVTAEQLASGRTFCFLYTDQANPTSNRIYASLGYEPVCDAVDVAFDAP